MLEQMIIIIVGRGNIARFTPMPEAYASRDSMLGACGRHVPSVQEERLACRKSIGLRCQALSYSLLKLLKLRWLDVEPTNRTVRFTSSGTSSVEAELGVRVRSIDTVHRGRGKQDTERYVVRGAHYTEIGQQGDQGTSMA